MCIRDRDSLLLLSVGQDDADVEAAFQKSFRIVETGADVQSSGVQVYVCLLYTSSGRQTPCRIFQEHSAHNNCSCAGVIPHGAGLFFLCLLYTSRCV